MVTALRLHAPVVLPCDPGCTVLRDAVVDVDGNGRIVHCGPHGDAPELPGAAVRQQLSGILLPGLINVHAHSPMTVLRGMGGDLPLLRWLHEVIWPAEAQLRGPDVHTGMLLGCVEMLRAGVTTSAEMYFHGQEIAEAVLAVGSRVVLGPAIIDAPGSERFGDWRQMVDAVSAWIDTDGRRFGPGDRIELGYGPHSAYTLPAEAISLVAAEAKQRGALMQIHVAESLAEDVEVRQKHGSVPLMLESLGALDGRVLAAHAVQLSDLDIQVLARNQVGVAHCPGSNAKLAAGTARLNDLRAAGVPVGLGTDGPASNDDLDLWEEVRLSALFTRLDTRDAAALTAAQALLLATRGGADALGRQDIGVLEPGRWADLVHVDVDDTAFAAGLDVPDGQIVSNLVWAGGSRRVADVWVAGDQVLAATEPTKVDRHQVQSGVRAVVRRLLR